MSKYAICAYWEECVHSLLYQTYVKYELSNSDKKFLKGHLAYTRFCHDERRCVFKSYSRYSTLLERWRENKHSDTCACFDSRTDDSNEPVLFMNRRIRLLIWTRLANLTELKWIKFARLKRIWRIITMELFHSVKFTYLWLHLTHLLSYKFHVSALTLQSSFFNVFNCKVMLISLWRASFLKFKGSCII